MKKKKLTEEQVKLANKIAESGGEVLAYKGHKIIYKRKNGDRAVMTCNSKPSMAKQEFKDSSDINNVIRVYDKTGILANTKDVSNAWGQDVSNGMDYHSAMNKLIDVQNEFMDLPAKVRKEFQNDPGELLDCLQNLDNEENYEKALKLGLIEKPSSKSDSKSDNAASNKADSKSSSSSTTEQISQES